MRRPSGAYGSTDAKHPAVAHLNRQPGHYASGRLEVHPRPAALRLRRPAPHPGGAPRALPIAGLESKIVAFQTRNPLHRAHEELTKRAAEQIGGGLLIHPVVGVTKPGDVDHYTRVRCYRALVDNYYEPGSVVLSLLPLAMRMAGPREVLLHAIIRRNYGCTHFIVGRDHAGPGKDSTGKPFYEPYAAQESMAQAPGRDRHGDGRLQADGLPARREPLLRRSTRSRRGPRPPTSPAPRSATKYLAKGLQLPEWFSRPAVAEILNETNPPQVPPGADHLVHRAVRLGQEHRRPRPDRAAGRVRPQLLAARRRRDPHPPVQGPGLQQGRPRHQHPPRRLRRRPGRRSTAARRSAR